MSNLPVHSVAQKMVVGSARSDVLGSHVSVSQVTPQQVPWSSASHAPSRERSAQKVVPGRGVVPTSHVSVSHVAGKYEQLHIADAGSMSPCATSQRQLPKYIPVLTSM